MTKIDEDLPLTYAYKFVKGSGKEVILGDFSQSTKLSAIFPAGSGENHTIEVIGFVSDSLGAISSSRTTISVSPIQVNEADMNEYIMNQTDNVLGGALEEGDSEKVFQVIGVLGDLLNDDEEDEENFKTLPPTDSTPIPSLNGTGELPSPAPIPLKQCRSKSTAPCTGHGICQRSIPECLVSDLDCEVKCICEDQWYGEACNIDEKGFLEKQKLLSTLLTAMANASATVDSTNKEAMEQQASSIATLTKSASALDEGAQDTALSFVDNLVNAALVGSSTTSSGTSSGEVQSVAAMSSAASDAVGDALSNLLDTTVVDPVQGNASISQNVTEEQEFTRKRKTDMARKNTRRITKMLTKLSTALLSSSLPGEAPIVLNTKNVKIAAQRDSADEMNGKDLYIPLTEAEMAAGYKPLLFTVPVSFSTEQKLGNRRLNEAGSNGNPCLVDSKSTLYSKNIHSYFPEPVNSKVMSLTMECDGQPMEVKNLADPFLMTFRNNRKIDAQEEDPLVLTHYCQAGRAENLTFDCFENGAHTLPCPKHSSIDQEVSFTCPTKVIRPLCQYWDELEQRWSNAGCQVVGVTEEYTHCACNHLTDFASGVEESFSAVSQHFENVMSTSNRITLKELKKNLGIALAIVSIYVLFIFGCIFSHRLDRRDREKLLREKRLKLKEAEHVKITNLFDQDAFADAKTFREKTSVLIKRAWQGIRENHKLLSIVFKYDENFTRPQRLTVIITATMSNMFCNALLYVLKQGPVTLASMLVSGLITSLCMAPVTVIFVLLFKKAAKKQDYIVRYQFEDLSGNVAEVQVDAYGKPRKYGKVDVLRIAMQGIANGLKPLNLQNVHKALNRRTMNKRVGIVTKAMFHMLFGDPSTDPGSKNTEKEQMSEFPTYQPLNKSVVVPSLSTLEASQKFKALRNKVYVHNEPVQSPETHGRENLHKIVSKSKNQELSRLHFMLGTDAGMALLTQLQQFDPIQMCQDQLTELEKNLEACKTVTGERQENECSEDEDECSAEVTLDALMKYMQLAYDCAVTYRSNASAMLERAKQDLKHAQMQLHETRRGLQRQLRQGIESLTREAEAHLRAKSPSDNQTPMTRRKIAKMASKKVIESKKNVVKNMRSEIMDMMQASKQQVMDTKKELERIHKQAKREAKVARQQAKKEMDDITKGLRGIKKVTKQISHKLESHKKAKLASLPLHEQHAHHIEEERAKKLSLHAKLMYNRFLRRKPQRVSEPLFPEWVNYLMYLICVGICLWCGYFIFLFAIAVGEYENHMWLGSVFVGLATTYIVADPLKIFFKTGVMPLVAANIVAGSALAETLTSMGAMDGDSVAALAALGAVGAAGVASMSPKKKERPKLIKAEAKATQEKAVIRPDALRSLPYIRLDKVSNVPLQNLVAGKQSSRIMSLSSVSRKPRCRCGLEVSSENRKHHMETECSHRIVTCRLGCGLKLQSRALNAHEMSQCRLIMCSCSKMVLKNELESHQATDCRNRIVDCSLGCGTKLPKNMIPFHQRKDCVNRIVTCPTCRLSLPSHELKRHSQDQCELKPVIKTRCNV